MRTRYLPGAVLGLCMHVSVQAAYGSLDFKIDSLTPMGDNATTPTPAGYWSGNTWVFGSLNTQASPTDSGNLQLFSPSTPGIGNLNGAPFGNFDAAIPAAPGHGVSTSSYLHPGNFGGAWQTGAATEYAFAGWSWSRPFVLNPSASLTLAGTVSYTSSDGVLQAQPSYTEGSGYQDPGQPPYNQGYLSYWLKDTDANPNNNQHFAVTLQGQLTSADPNVPGSPALPYVPSGDDFDYSVDSFGHLSMTISNHTAGNLFGWLNLGAYIGSPQVPAIPEPVTWMAMLLGLGLVTFRRSRQPSP